MRQGAAFREDGAPGTSRILLWPNRLFNISDARKHARTSTDVILSNIEAEYLETFCQVAEYEHDGLDISFLNRCYDPFSYSFHLISSTYNTL